MAVGRERSRRGQVEPFHAMEVLAEANRLEAAGEPILHLETGQPGGLLPERVARRVADALARPGVGYTEAPGRPALRQGIAELYRRWYGLDIPPERILVTTGASGAFILAFTVLFDPGARVLLGEPGYPAYKALLKAMSLEPVIARTTLENRFQPVPADFDAHGPLEGAVLASPANPTGTLLGPAELEAMAAAAGARGVHLIMDEIYHGLVYTGEQRSLLEMAPAAVVINSFSKFFGLTGFRVGWMVVPDDLVEPVTRLAQNLFIAPPTPSQIAAEAVLEEEAQFSARVETYGRNRRLLLDALAAGGLERIAPADGAFYLYVDVEDITTDSSELSQRLLREVGIGTTPGIDFDAGRGHRYLRLSYAGETAEIEKAAARLKAWLPAQRRNRRRTAGEV